MGGSVIYFLLIFSVFILLFFVFGVNKIDTYSSYIQNRKLRGIFTYKTDKSLLLISSFYLYFVLLIIRVFFTI
jgi:hypothetical protein